MRRNQGEPAALTRNVTTCSGSDLWAIVGSGSTAGARLSNMYRRSLPVSYGLSRSIVLERHVRTRVRQYPPISAAHRTLGSHSSLLWWWQNTRTPPIFLYWQQ